MPCAIEDDAETVTRQSLFEYGLTRFRVIAIRSACDWRRSPIGSRLILTEPLLPEPPKPPKPPAKTVVFFKPGNCSRTSRATLSSIDCVAAREVPCGPRTFT